MKKMIVFLVMLFLFVLSVGVPFAATLQWSESDGADGYTIYFSDGANQYNYTVGLTLSCDTSDLHLVPGVDYTFTVRAYNQYGESVDSNSVAYSEPQYSPPEDVLPAAGEGPPDAPEGLQI